MSPAYFSTGFFVREPAWHGQGTVVHQAQTSAEAIKLAGLDWEVRPERLHTESGIAIPDRFGLVRTDKQQVLAVVSNQYRPLQNRDAFRFFDQIVGTKEAIFHTAGSLKNGGVIWLLCKLPEPVIVRPRSGPIDVVDKYLLLSNSHDTTMAVRIGFTPIRVVCWNTLSAALGSAENGYTIAHRGSFDARFAEARKAMGLANAWYERIGAKWQVLASTQYTSETLTQYLNDVLPLPEEPAKTAGAQKWHEFYQARDKATQEHQRVAYLAEHGAGLDAGGLRGTAWALYNATVEWQDHEVGSQPAAHLGSIWFGQGAQLKVRAFDAALALAN